MFASMHLKLTNKNHTVEYVSDQEALKECVKFLSSSTRLALDLEFDRDRHAYGFNLCLIQACSGNRCFIIDPLEKIDCSEFYRLLENPDILIILHSHGEDLRLLHSLGCKPVNLFDSDFAAKLLGYEKTSLAAMLENLMGIMLNKSQQKTNWLQRPLSAEQILYASNDVVYLEDLMNALIKQAQEKKLNNWINEENENLSTTDFTIEVKEDFLTSKDRKELSPYHQFILNEWLKLRDSLAAELKKPSYQVISPDTIRDIVAGKTDVKSWLTLPGIYRKLKNENYCEFFIQKNDEFIKAAEVKSLSKSLDKKSYLSAEEWERRKQSMAEKERIKAEVFMPIKQSIAVKYGTSAASFILSNTLIEEIIRGNLKINDMKLSYRKELIQAIASELKLDLSPWL